MPRPRSTAPAWPVHAGFVAVLTVAGTSYALAGPTGRPLVFFLVTALPMITFLISLGNGSLPDRRPWTLAVLGLALLLVIPLRWPDWLGGLHLGRAEGSLTDLTMSTAHTLFLMGTAVALRRRASADPGGMIDAALFGICAGGPLWEWLVRPHLPDGATAGGQLLLLGDLLVLCAVAGCLLRIGMMAEAGRGTLAYLIATSVLTLAAMITSAAPPGGEALWSAELLLAAFLCIAAAPLHPGASALTVPPPAAAQARKLRLWWLAASLCANPVIAAVQVIRGEQSSSLLLPLGTLLVVPLVLARIRLLSTQRDRAERTLAYHATHDELTGLHNRRHITAEIDRALVDLDRGALDEVTILLCDLDGFKPVNDRYGHPAGDAVLRTVAARLTAVVRADDLVGRLGGDEFLILCRGSAGLDPTDLAARIAETVATPVALPDATAAVGVTTGVARARPGQGLTREALISHADAAMYAGKAGRGRPSSTLEAVRHQA